VPCPDVDATAEDEQSKHDDLMDRLARRVVALQMAAPAIFMLETSKPLSYIASQALIVLEPIVQSVFDFRDYDTLQRMMEKRVNVEKLIRRIEDLEDDRIEAERAERRAARERRRERRDRAEGARRARRED